MSYIDAYASKSTMKQIASSYFITRRYLVKCRKACFGQQVVNMLCYQVMFTPCYALSTAGAEICVSVRGYHAPLTLYLRTISADHRQMRCENPDSWRKSAGKPGGRMTNFGPKEEGVNL